MKAFAHIQPPGVPMANPGNKGRDNSKKAILKRIRRKEPEDAVEYSDLPAWVRSGVTMVDVLGITQAAAAKRLGKNITTFNQYLRKSPAVARWRLEIAEVSNDPKAMAEMTLKANSLNVTLDYFAAYEKAIDAGDYATVAKVSQDLLDRVGITKKKDVTDAPKMNVVLHIGGGGGIDIPEVSATYEEIEPVDTDYEILEDDEA